MWGRVTAGRGEAWTGIQTDSLHRDDFCEHFRKTAKENGSNCFFLSGKLILCLHSQSCYKNRGSFKSLRSFVKNLMLKTRPREETTEERDALSAQLKIGRLDDESQHQK